MQTAQSKRIGVSSLVKLFYTWWYVYNWRYSLMVGAQHKPNKIILYAVCGLAAFSQVTFHSPGTWGCATLPFLLSWYTVESCLIESIVCANRIKYNRSRFTESPITTLPAYKGPKKFLGCWALLLGWGVTDHLQMCFFPILDAKFGHSRWNHTSIMETSGQQNWPPRRPAFPSHSR